MTILVTGSAGHLGEALMRTLRIQNRSVRGLDLRPSPFTDHVGSITDRGFVRACMQGVSAVLHTATLHKPHVTTHSRQDFVDTNITGTLHLLEEAAAAGIGAFIFTSTTSTFGAAMTPTQDGPATWITEDIVPIPKNIYGVTKVAAENLCEMFARKDGLPVVILRTSRFFPEPDDNPDTRAAHDTRNAQANELLYRRADIADIVTAHLLAHDRAQALRFGRYIVSATTPFTPADLDALHRDAPAVVARLFPEYRDLYARQGWTMFPAIDRVYRNDNARAALGWQPRYDFTHVLNALRTGADIRSPLAIEIGAKGYHAETFVDGIYPVAR